MRSYHGKRARKRPPRRLAGCGHYVYAWRDRERCNDCIAHETKREPGEESLREFRARVFGSGR